jgi:uncharacterized protein YdaU (DUF1376 family)
MLGDRTPLAPRTTSADSMQETKFIYFPLYLSDYVSEARKMTMLQRGAFVDLACLYFQDNLELSYTKQQIYRMVFAMQQDEQEAVDFILQKYFKQTEKEPMGLIWVSDSLNLVGARVLKRLEANRNNGKKGGRGNKKDNKPMGSEVVNPTPNPDESILNQTKLNQTKPIKPKGFISPSLQDIQNYCKERKNSVSASKFFDYYSVSEWKDKDGKAVKNWKQKLLSWEGRDATTGSTATPKDSFAESINQQIGQDLVASVTEKPDHVQVALHSATACDKWMKIPQATRDEIAQQVRAKFSKEPKLKF